MMNGRICGSPRHCSSLPLLCAQGGFESGFDAPRAGMGAASGGQTREHAQLAKSLGIDQLAVVVTKLDTCDYDGTALPAHPVRCCSRSGSCCSCCGVVHGRWLALISNDDAPSLGEPQQLGWSRNGTPAGVLMAAEPALHHSTCQPREWGLRARHTAAIC